MPKKGRFEKGSPEAIEFMAQIRQVAKEKREAIANGDLEKIDKPKKDKKPKKVKEAVIFKAKEEEPIISEEDEPEPVRKVEVPSTIPPPKKFDKKPRSAPPPEPEPEPVGVIEEQEPGVPAKRAYKKKEVVVEEKPIVVKVPPKKVKKIIIEEEEEEKYEVEYRKAPAPKKVPEKKQVVNNIKDIPLDNPLLGSRVYRNK
jgi:hypothetical protein